MTKAIIIHNSIPYLTVKQLSDELGCSEQTIRNYRKGIEAEKDRYGRYAILDTRLSLYAVLDYIKYKNYLSDRNLRKNIPQFEPAEIARMCGAGMEALK